MRNNMRKSYTIIFALIALLSMTMGVQALESKEIVRQNGAYASADWVETNDGVTTYTYLSVTETCDGTDIYVSMWTYDEITGTLPRSTDTCLQRMMFSV
jgi:hypothetical protein